MLDAILGFFSDLILFTAGLAVLTMWIIIFGAIAVEIHDAIWGEPEKEE